jgi:hypothetical protein
MQHQEVTQHGLCVMENLLSPTPPLLPYANIYCSYMWIVAIYKQQVIVK